METGVWLILGGKPLELPHSLEKEVEATVLLTTWPQPPPPPRSSDPTIRREDGQQGRVIKVLFFLGGGITVRDEVLKRLGENTLQPQRGGATGALQGCVLPGVGVQEP